MRKRVSLGPAEEPGEGHSPHHEEARRNAGFTERDCADLARRILEMIRKIFPHPKMPDNTSDGGRELARRRSGGSPGQLEDLAFQLTEGLHREVFLAEDR